MTAAGICATQGETSEGARQSSGAARCCSAGRACGSGQEPRPPHTHSLTTAVHPAGKTRCINHFLINGAWWLVDLPGYGWAVLCCAVLCCAGCTWQLGFWMGTPVALTHPLLALCAHLSSVPTLPAPYLLPPARLTAMELGCSC
jgi:hypothetical protein